MFFFDIYEAIGAWAYALSGLISLVIGLIALRGFMLFRNWRFLFLSLAFLVLSILPLTVFIDFFVSKATFNLPGNNAPILVIALALLSIVYADEIRKESIKITRTQWLVVGTLILPELILIIFLLSENHGDQSFFDYLYIVFYMGVAYVLIILVLASLFTYYKTKGGRSTLLTMMGFICLLFGQMIGVSIYVYVFIFALLPFAPSSAGYFLMVGFINLLGYLAFLVAMIRTRVAHG